MKGYILALDQGTTSSRALVYDLNGNVISVSQREIKQYYPKPGWVEHDPEEIFKTQIDVAKDAVKKAGGSENLLAVAITNQRETTVVWDKKSGKPVYKAIVWQCRRSAGICDELKNEGYESLIREKTGLVVDAYFSATKIMWLFRKYPELYSAAKKGEIAFGTIDSWLIYKLTGNHLTDYSNASRTMIFNIKTLNWDEELLDIYDIPRSILPEARPPFSNFGLVKDTYFGKSVPIMGVIGDQQASLLGQGCIDEGMVKNTYGTGCFVLMNTGRTPYWSKKGLLTTCAWGKDKNVTYALEGSVFIGGAVIQWLRDGLKIIEKASQTEELAIQIENNGGVYFVPAFVGLGAPYWNMKARGTITGITRGTDYRHIVRAALESIAYQSYDVIKSMEEDSNLQLKELRVDGGASANNFLMQFQSDILGVKILRPEVLESTSRGAFFAAALNMGIFSIGDINKMIKISKEFKPEMDVKEKEELLKGWKDAVRKTLIYKIID